MIERFVIRVRGGHRSERGAVLVISAAYLVVTIISCALAVDLGGLEQTARENQKIADLAALDAASVLPGDPTNAAIASAARNGYTANANNFKVECAPSISGPFTTGQCNNTANYVRVTVSSTHTNEFPYVGPSQLVGRPATAGAVSRAGFSLGSALARVDATVEAPLFSRVFERLLGSNTGSIGVTAVGYTGLASSYVTLGQIASQLGFGTVDQLLAANITVKQLLQATANAMQAGGNTAYVEVNTILNTVSQTSVANTTYFNLNNMVILGSGGANNAANTQVNVFQLISASAELINKNNFVSVPNAMTNVNVPNVGSVGTTLGLKVIEPPKIYIGPVTYPASLTPNVTTSQVEVTFTSTITNMQISLAGIQALYATGTLQTVVSGAGAKGWLTGVRCSGATQGIDVQADTQAVSTSVTSPSGALTLKTLLGTTAGTIDVQGSSTGVPSSSVLSFLYPSEFSPSAASKQTSSSAMNTTVTGTTTGNVTLLGVSFSNSTVAGAVLTSAKPLFDQLVVQLKRKELSALGYALGVADVSALYDAFIPSECGQPGLVG